MHTLAEKIAREIAETGPLPFARFMELALYCPECGYYETHKDTVGQRGDYYTSASVGALFGRLLAFQFAAWFDELNSPDPRPSTLDLVEAGAHDGRLARDILGWLRAHRLDLFERLRYGIIEPSARRRQWQSETLLEYVPCVQWYDSLEALAQDAPQSAGPRSSALDPRLPAGICGVFFSNELLDAMPVRRFGWNAHRRAWFEWGVTVKGGCFHWAQMGQQDSEARDRDLYCGSPMPLSDGCASESGRGLPQSKTSQRSGQFREKGAAGTIPPDLKLPDALLDVLPDGYIVEISEAAQDWWREAARVLRRGRLLTLDYGLTADELLRPERTGGTLRAYHRHRVTDDVLADVGEQDLTAHVNFSAIQAVGELEGLVTEQFTTQGQFLTRIAAEVWQKPTAYGDRADNQTRQFQTLTHPEHLGRAFRVLVQARP